jgi:coenzyme F420 hydrogenase subunit beta
MCWPHDIAMGKGEFDMSNVFTSEALKRVAKGSLCSGCGGCAMAAPGKITMQMQAPGYLRPVQSDALSATEEDTIAAICPGLCQTVTPQGRTDDPIWGPYVEMMVGWSTDPDLRYTASSGGGISAVLMHLLDTRAVDGVVQTSASTTNPIGNDTVISRSSEEILTAAGSRYAPSDPLSLATTLLDGSERFAFVGKPCDIAALRAMQARDPRAASVFPYLVSFFCGGIPSEAGANKVVDRLGVDQNDLATFRYRGNGWPGYATATRHDGTNGQMSYNDSWGKILSSHVQHRCKICADGSGKAADIVCADAWEVDDNGYPLFEDQDGISLIVSRTKRGAQVLSDTASAGKLELQPFDMSALPKIQKGQFWRRKVVAPRLLALRLTGKPVPSYSGLNLWGMQRLSTPALFARNFLGMIKRVIRGRM